MDRREGREKGESEVNVHAKYVPPICSIPLVLSYLLVINIDTREQVLTNVSLFSLSVGVPRARHPLRAP